MSGTKIAKALFKDECSNNLYTYKMISKPISLIAKSQGLFGDRWSKSACHDENGGLCIHGHYACAYRSRVTKIMTLFWGITHRNIRTGISATRKHADFSESTGGILTNMSFCSPWWHKEHIKRWKLLARYSARNERIPIWHCHLSRPNIK